MHRARLALGTAFLVVACADAELDPGDLAARDLLGFEPGVAARWDAGERAEARRVLSAALRETPGDTREIPLGVGARRNGVLASLAALDRELELGSAAPWLLSRVDLDEPAVRIDGVPFGEPLESAATDAPVTWRGWNDLDELASRGDGLGEALARAAGHGDEVLFIEPAPRALFGASYLAADRILLVNPVLLAALEPVDDERAGKSAAGARAGGGGETRAVYAVNPYNFYGSVGECAAAERVRCESCLPSSTCEPTTRGTNDGNAECTTLAADGGRGYYQLCTNLALVIASVADCVRGRNVGCSFDDTAGNQLGLLEINESFLANDACLSALDACLSDIYGSPDGTYPPPPTGDGGPGTLPPPRDVTFDCGDCNSDTSCDLNASCGSCDSSSSGGSSSCGSCEGPNCEGGGCSTGACDSGCDGESSSSSSGSGCSSCDSDSSTSSSSSSCGSCDSGSSSSESSSCGSCDSGSSSSSSSCGSCDSGSGSGSSSSCGSCGSSSSGGSSSCGSGCSTVPPFARRANTLVVTLGWALLPVLVLLRWRRRGGGR